MKYKAVVRDRYEDARPKDLVSFSVICRPRSDKPFDNFRKVSTRRALEAFLPEPDVVAGISAKLRKLGFEVFDLRGLFKASMAIPQPIVSARGRVDLFERTFGGQLVKLIRTRIRAGAKTVTSAIVLRRGSKQPSLERLSDAVRIVFAHPAVYEATATPPPVQDFCLHLPGDVALLTRASATHRLSTPAGARATGAGVTVAVVDSGFWNHPYYRDHGYRITRVASPDTTDPDDDPDGHGTKVLANLLACAPDVHAYGIKAGLDHVLAFLVAMIVPGVSVISISWGYSPDDEPTDLEFLIRLAVLYLGITVVVAAGDGPLLTFPALMDEVIAVGGVSVTPKHKLSVWNGSFSSAYGSRNIPDFCGLSSELLLPNSGPSPDWETDEGTSFAAPQVAGVAALLLQKNQALTPDQVRKAIRNTATDIKRGTSATGDRAKPGIDIATGTGLVHALKAWNSV